MKSWFEHSWCDEGASIGQVRERIETFVEELGLTRFAFGMYMPRAHSPGESAVGDFPAVLTNYPEEWFDRYMRLRYDRIDPVVELAARLNRPFLWGGARFRRGFLKQQQRVLDEGRDYGIAAGLVIPLHDAGGAHGLFTVVAGETSRLRDAVRGEHERLFAAAFDLQDFMRDRLPDTHAAGAAPDAGLSLRERECLLWTAEGRTAAEVADRLGLSVSTVNRHLSNAARQLGCANKHHAVYRALRAGVI